LTGRKPIICKTVSGTAISGGKEPDITVGAGQTQSALLFPAKLIGWREEGVRMKATTPEAGFTLGVIPAGENGMSIAVLQGGKVLRKNILVTITQE